MITTEQIVKNFDTYITLLKIYSGNRYDSIKLMIEDLGEENIALAPASPKKLYHGAYPGGLILHLLNVCLFSEQIYSMWQINGANMNGYEKEELLFSALVHDLGKIGDKNKPYYIPQEDDWRKNKLGEVYTYNPDIISMKHCERSLYLLQKYNIHLSENEFLSIMVHDGLYDERNEFYFKAPTVNQIFKTNMPIILHHADYMAYRIELEKE